MNRILIFTGKGGVGKSSVAAAHARCSSLKGIKTLLVSTDMAHNLGDIFQLEHQTGIRSADSNLDILEIDPNYVMTHEYQDMYQAFAKMFASANISADAMEVMNTVPGMDELFCLIKIMDLYKEGIYERIIVDCAPTGETLSLLKFPELLSWYMEKFFPIEKVALKVLRPVSKKIFKIELPDQKAMSDVEKIYVKLQKLQELLKNEESTSIRLVTIPEKMVVDETRRNYMYLNLYGFHVDGVYINRILPADIQNTFFTEWLEIQERYIEEIQNTFVHLPIYNIPWFDTDLNGMIGIDKVVELLIDKEHIFDTCEAIKNEYYEKTLSGYQLTLYLPCIDKEELEMHDSPTDIIIKIGNFKRSIPKPNVLRDYEIGSAAFKEEQLILKFEKGD